MTVAAEMVAPPRSRVRSAAALAGLLAAAVAFLAFGIQSLEEILTAPLTVLTILGAPILCLAGAALVLVLPFTGGLLMALGAFLAAVMFGDDVLANLLPVDFSGAFLAAAGAAFAIVLGAAGALLAYVDFSEGRRASRAHADSAPAVTAGGARIDRAVMESTLAGLVTLALAGPIVGLQTAAGLGEGLAIVPRWGTVAVMVGVVFFGRLLLTLFVWRNRPVTRRAVSLPTVRKRIPFVGQLGGPLLLVAAGAMPMYMIFVDPDDARYRIEVGILVLTYVMLGWGLNIVVGLAGLLDLGYVAFYGIGAYSYALLAEHFGWSFWICLPLAGILSAFWGILLGFPVLRLRGDYLAIVTLAFGEIIRIVLRNWESFTGGPNGMLNIARPSFFGLEFNKSPDGFAEFFGLEYSPVQRIIFLYYLILVLALITNFVTLRIRRLPIGRAWEALREDETACRSLGINTTNTKLTAFAMGAMFGGFAGAFFATRQGSISPESFNFIESATILAIVVLGGLGSQIGIAIAAIVMIGGVEELRRLNELKAVFGEDFDPGQYRLLIFGLVMVAIMVWRPRGLVSTRRPSVFLRDRKPVSAALVEEGRG